MLCICLKHNLCTVVYECTKHAIPCPVCRMAYQHVIVLTAKNKAEAELEYYNEQRISNIKGGIK